VTAVGSIHVDTWSRWYTWDLVRG